MANWNCRKLMKIVDTHVTHDYDKYGYKTIWASRNKYKSLKKSIKEYFSKLNQNFTIKKELSN